MIKHCENCKHHELEETSNILVSFCHHTLSIFQTDDTSSRQFFMCCENMRKTKCGKFGSLFEKREEVRE